MRIIDRSDYYEPTNKLFVKYNTLKFHDTVTQKTALLAYKAQQRLLPGCIQELFNMRDTHYELRGKLMLEIKPVRTNIKKRCPSLMAAETWNKCNINQKMCNSTFTFKKMFKDNIVHKYKTLLGTS